MNQELILILSSIKNTKLMCTRYSIYCHGIECENCILAPVYEKKYYNDLVMQMGERIL